MKNGIDKIFNVKESFVIADSVVVMNGDQLKHISTDRDKDTDIVYIYFEVINSHWCEGLKINLTPEQVAQYLLYNKTIH